jgi:hypothetical protein
VPPRDLDLSTYNGESTWTRARDGDDLDQMRLASEEGALGLLEGYGAGGWVREVALLAMPLAGDAELCLATLCEGLASAGPEVDVLRAVHGIVSVPERQTERLDATGYRSCERVLAVLAGDKSVSPELHDLAQGALDALKGRHQSQN